MIITMTLSSPSSSPPPRYGDQWWIGATVHGPHGEHQYGNWTWDHNGVEIAWWDCHHHLHHHRHHRHHHNHHHYKVWLDEKRAERLAWSKLPDIPQGPGEEVFRLMGNFRVSSVFLPSHLSVPIIWTNSNPLWSSIRMWRTIKFHFN